ncbi:putative protein phosphatase 2C 14 [Tasmannia lanceolata]|uniref:putative protein phosphatase 2C 14 n=1 Tax=Tasmannia lanceolata TaxID=3420 RepID=UPI0040631CAA
MPGVSSFIDENRKPLNNVLHSCFHHPKDNSDSSVLTEINNTQPSTTSSSCYSLKRKRPPKIQIPSVLQELQMVNIKCRAKAFEDETVGYMGTGYGVFAKKGKKKFMEDTHKIISHLNGDSKKGFFGVYDGHGGRRAAEFVAENLHGNILGIMEKCKGRMGKQEAIKAGYLMTDREYLKQGLASGTCCVTALIEEGDISVSNLGDCRAVLCRGGVAEALTNDHKAGREDERNRIESKGGYVDNHRGTWRVQDTLAVSRSIGDFHLKEWVLAEPDSKIFPFTSDMEFLVLASDGLWEKVGNQEAIDAAKKCIDVNNLGTERNHQKEDDADGFGCENTSPLSKARRVSLDHPKKMKTRCTTQENGFPIDLNNLGTERDHQKEDNDDEFGCENTSPPSKARRISLSCPQKLKIACPTQENGYYRFMAACKELVNLAVVKGSLDDITVMIVDLKHFYCD